MNTLERCSPRMGWLGVQTAGDALYCWPCAVRMKHHGYMLTREDVLADDTCDRCGRNMLTGEHPVPDVTRQLTEAQKTGGGWFYARMRDCDFRYERPRIISFHYEPSRGIRLRKLRWRERLSRWWLGVTVKQSR